MQPKQRQGLIMRAGAVTIASNVVITLARAMAGALTGSTAVLADAANSGTDVAATLVVLLGSRIAALPPDEEHPYGHEKAEQVAAKLVGLLIAATGVLTAAGAVHALRGGGAERIGALAAWVTAASMIAKETLARYLLRVGRATGNQALLADAANQRTDVLTSAAALVGALGGRFGLPILDPAMGVLVCGLILRMGLGLYWRSVNELMDHAPDRQTLERLAAAASDVAGVLAVNQIKARVSGAGIFVDCKVQVDGRLTVEEGHRIAGRVKAAVRGAVPSAGA